jgi:riboflavin synthase
MFTGIIEEIGTLKDSIPQGAGRRIQIGATRILNDLTIDQSVSVNGICLTVVEIGPDFFSADAVAETMAVSTLSQLKRNDRVNLERALRLQDRLGGHLVQGHVDGIGVIQNLTHQPQGSTWTIEIPAELERYTISKGSIAIDGVSLTIARKSGAVITVAIIPHTIKQTIFQFKKRGDAVNIEVDFLAKYIEQFVKKPGETKITTEWLKQQGY